MKPGSSTRKYMVEAWTSVGPYETYHPSQPAAYREVARIREGIAAGTHRVAGVHVKKWEDGQWRSFERLAREELSAP